jgi:hypothetical protein
MAQVALSKAAAATMSAPTPAAPSPAEMAAVVQEAMTECCARACGSGLMFVRRLSVQHYHRKCKR